MQSRTSRRIFLARSGAGLGLMAMAPSRPRAFRLAQDPTFLESMGKHPSMIVHNSNPGVAETPLELLRQHRITPANLLFVRNNQVLEGSLTLEPLPLTGWTFELSGAIDSPRVLRGEDLLQIPTDETEMVLQCSGTGRSFYAASARTRGTQWGRGGMGNVQWKGVSLATLLESLGIRVQAEAQYLTAEGKDGPATPQGADFEHSIPIQAALERSLLAFEMNGKSIPAIHGGPLRLIIPGFYGTMNIKWLQRLRFEREESKNSNHSSRYRTSKRPIEPGSAVGLDVDNSTPTWNQRLKSIAWAPLEGGKIDAGQTEASGVAWNDGSHRIEGVECSVDRGLTWRRADLETPSSPFAWYHWRMPFQTEGARGEVWVRATDVTGRSQPLDGSIHWNPSGYEWHGVDKVPYVAG